jgi:L1 cell adhesion molecule like protein
MIDDAQIYNNEDQLERHRIQAKNTLEYYCFNIKTKLNNDKLAHEIDINYKNTIIDVIDETLNWLERDQVKYILFLSFFIYFFKIVC